MTAEEMFKTALELHQRGQYGQAEDLYRQLLVRAPNHPVTRHFLGMVLHHQGKSSEGYELVKKSAETVDSEVFWSNFGSVCRALKKYDEAEAALLKSVAKDPRAAPAFNNLGNLYTDMGRLDDAAAAFHKALDIDEKFPDARGNLAKALANGGRYEEAFREFRKALDEKPNANEHGDLCFHLQFDVNQSVEDIYAEHMRWGALYGGTASRPEPTDKRPERVLRIGYVGGDFREHPAGHLLLPLMENHDRAQFTIYIYATQSIDDDLKLRFEKAASQFIFCGDMTNGELAQRIKSDAIDVLVDCSNHTLGNRLEVFALRPAPIQMTMVGFPSTIGMPAIDYRFTDSYFDPPESPLPSAEELLRIDPCAWCYDPGKDVPAVGELPALKNGFVTFGSQNSLHKAGRGSVELWAEVLRQVPGSRMLLVGGNMEGQPVAGRANVLKMFAERGIGMERLNLVNRCGRSGYFTRYGEMDIGLDPFPGHGGLTTLDGLYMGVPVVTLAGKTYASRTGVSLMNNVGLGTLVAASKEEYVAKAEQLAAELQNLTQIRRRLREQIRDSALMKGADYARRVEDAFRRCWTNLCAS